MKNLFKISLLAVAIATCSTAVLFTACKKENNITKNDIKTTQLFKNNFRVADFQIIKNPLSIENYLINNEDADDEKINRQLYEIGLIARELFIDNKLNEYIFSKASQNDNNCVDLIEMTSNASLRETVQNKNAFDKLKSLVAKVDLTHKSTNPANEGEIEKYIPAIFVANLNNADFDEIPICSPGIDVNAELKGAENYANYAIAWLYSESKNFEEILINEEMAMTTKKPIFIIDNAEYEITHRPKTQYEQPAEDNQNTAWFSGYEYQIFYRWDNSNYSEFAICAAHINENGNVLLCLKKSNGTYDTWKKIADVHKNNIGKVLYRWEQLCNPDLMPYNTNFVFWNTFEYDWDHSNKLAGEANRNGKTIYLYGKRKYTNDCYAFLPNQVNANPLDLNYIYWNWAKWHYGNAGNYRIWRIQP